MTAEGTRVGSRYLVVAPLGRGGMGVVWVADDERLGRRVALKELSPAALGDPTARARLIREARLAASLEHPHIVRTYDVGETPDGGAFLVMELVRGKSLAQLLGESTFSLAERLSALVSIARALAHAHRAGLVHRDVKPDNVMREDGGRIVLLDLGVAKPIAAAAGASDITATEHGAIVGTPAYLAPEQARGAAIDARADQFALGVTAYQLVTGRLPWSSTNVAGVLAEVVADTPPPPSAHVPELPASVDAVVMRALEKRADDRFRTMDALADALEVARADLSPSVRAPLAMPVDASAATTPAVPATGDGAKVETPRPTPPSAVDPIAATALSARTGARSGGSRRALAVVASLGVVALLAWGGFQLAQRSPLEAPGSVVACPPLAVESSREGEPWIGAVAASLVCQQAAVFLGGDGERTRVPAELLDLPRVPTADVERDPYVRPDARERAIVAARARAAAWVDGVVRPGEDDFVVELVLRDASGGELGRSTARAPVLPRAVGEAFRALRPALPVLPLSPVAADLLGTSDVESASWLVQWLAMLSVGSYICDDECPRLVDDARISEDQRDVVRYWCAHAAADREPAFPVAIDATSPATVARTAFAALAVDPAVDFAALLEAVTEARAHSTSPQTTARLVALELTARTALGQDGEELAIASVSTDPRLHVAWAMLDAERYGLPEAGATAAAYAAWVPEEPDAWNVIGHAVRAAGDPVGALGFTARGVRIGGDFPLFASNFAVSALARGDRDTARALAARLSLRTRPGQRVGSQGILAAIDLAEMHFQAAVDRSHTTFSTIDVLGGMDWIDAGLLETSARAARVLGRQDEIVSAFTERFLDPEPPRVTRGGGYLPAMLAPLCATASDVALGTRCLARLRRLLQPDCVAPDSIPSVTSAILDGSDHLIAGDVIAAARLLRDVSAPAGAMLLGHEAEARAGVPDAGERLATIVDDTTRPVGWIHVVAAREAAARSDHARAAALADRIVRAWAGADAEIPVLPEMRALAAPP